MVVNGRQFCLNIGNKCTQCHTKSSKCYTQCINLMMLIGFSIFNRHRRFLRLWYCSKIVIPIVHFLQMSKFQKAPYQIYYCTNYCIACIRMWRDKLLLYYCNMPLKREKPHIFQIYMFYFLEKKTLTWKLESMFYSYILLLYRLFRVRLIINIRLFHTKLTENSSKRLFCFDIQKKMLIMKYTLNTQTDILLRAEVCLKGVIWIWLQ